MNLIHTLKIFIGVSIISVSSAFAQDTKVSFQSTVQYGSQKNNIAVLVSSDFSGDYTMEGIKAATWKDITKNFTLATGKEPEKSGEVNLGKVSKKPQYIAIRYLGEASAKPTQRGWAIQDLSFINGTSITPVKEWKLVNSGKNHEGAGWILGKNNRIQFRSNQSLLESESWAITPVHVSDDK